MLITFTSISEPPVGFEPTTTRLQGGYSTPELRRRISNGIRTRVATVKGWSPRPLDHGDLAIRIGLEPTTSTVTG
jgi:hypothetical protein